MVSLSWGLWTFSSLVAIRISKWWPGQCHNAI